MKIRNGFVSNSSSSSFIVYNKTTGEVAREMIEIVEKEWQEWGFYNPKLCPCCNQELEGQDPPDTRNKKALEFLAARPDFNSPICIPWTTNYETFIFKYNNQICVDTCNNHNFWNIASKEVHEDTPWEIWKHKGRSYFNLECFKTQTYQTIKEEIEEKYNAYCKEDKNEN